MATCALCASELFLLLQRVNPPTIRLIEAAKQYPPLSLIALHSSWKAGWE